THGHGTFMAGIICRANDYLYFDLNLYMIRIGNPPLGPYEEAEAIRKAIQGPDGNVGTNDDADILSMSFGGPPSSIRYEAIKFASSRNVIMIAAAGNRGDGNTSTNEIDYP
ncbi:MAG: S8 family serine peptidase, partial [Candidatus Korarchaeota archaeon]|nr:S8 family serine peptidase [Candidatus Korarchaeota archaeon]NIU82198.1 S8 family serine peptidase [Candidatus Thorarchaeota archaeon]NIW14556.1 S8 family serine peptidase [Candidatus Thorarchaeota archaeon]NIW52628.1 S8 family serine peptidase [Candidatus Korarchaeota archaeon]